MAVRLAVRLSSAMLLALLLQEAASAQGFLVYSGRNHPELKWRVASTEHFRIVYPRHLEGIAAEAAPIAEASYATLSANLGVAFEKPIRIYLSDEDEISNGFAVRLGNGHTNIWVHQNDLEQWTGPDKWLRRVIAHELAHVFHYRAIRSNAGLLQFLMANPIPPFWAEGIAQYQTETWNAQRGDRWLRTAVLDDRLSYSDGTSIWNGRLMYALGHSQVRYFATTYGDSALSRMLAHRAKRLLGIFRVHDFGSAMKATIDQSYRQFYDDWRRHVNVYYNTLAGQMESVDSLAFDPVSVPGNYVEDLQFSPDTSLLAAVVVTSVRRPVRRLVVMNRASKETRVVAEGAIGTPVSWSPDGTRIAFNRRVRGPHGSLLNDLFVVDASGSRERRLTHGRRAISPTFSPDGRRLAFAGSEGGTADVFVLDLDSGVESRLTRFERDTQLAHLRWQPDGDLIALSRFAADGTRDVAIVDTRTGEMRSLTSGAHDDRSPVWSPDGAAIAYTSFRDDVPNVFVRRLDAGSEERVTRVDVGASATHWLPPDSTHARGRIVVVSNATKEGDRSYAIAAERRSPDRPIEGPWEYTRWTEKKPPSVVPLVHAPDPSLVLETRPYRSLRNVTHAFSLALPYYNSADDWGVFGVTSWIEPLGKHVFAAIGGLSIASPADESYFVGSYVNNQLYPTIALTGYRFPGSARVYGNDLLLERYSGADVVVRWPLDWLPRPYTSTEGGVRLRLAAFDPINLEDIVENLDDLPPPERGEQADVTIAWQRKRLRPYVHNVVHPLDGFGLRLRATTAGAVLGTEKTFVRGDASAYVVLGDGFLPALHRVFVYGRAQAQWGDSFPQDYLGFSRYDELRIDLPGAERLLTGDEERVRGYRRYAIGDRVLFGSIEYRVPVLSSLQTRLFGVISLGATTVSGFADAGAVWSGADFENADRRLGAGVEVKNAIRIGRVFEFSHALGIGWPLYEEPGAENEIYYRIRTSLPF
ncbi:MAG TPA: hypothetical protein VF190_12355 [Rhodothermales bacterium]